MAQLTDGPAAGDNRPPRAGVARDGRVIGHGQHLAGHELAIAHARRDLANLEEELVEAKSRAVEVGVPVDEPPAAA